MMKSADDRLSSDLAEPLDRSTARRILVERQMRSEIVVIKSIVSKNPAQMRLAKDDDVIETFAADRTDQSLRMPVRSATVSVGPSGGHGCQRWNRRASPMSDNTSGGRIGSNLRRNRPVISP